MGGKFPHFGDQFDGMKKKRKGGKDKKKKKKKRKGGRNQIEKGERKKGETKENFPIIPTVEARRSEN